MTDLEICKRIAEIEELNPFVDSIYPSTSNMVIFVPIDDDSDEVYDPLGDDLFAKALCFELMVKHDVKLERLNFCEPKGSGTFSAYISEDSSDCKCDENPQRAILLAIIEAHTND